MTYFTILLAGEVCSATVSGCNALRKPIGSKAADFGSTNPRDLQIVCDVQHMSSQSDDSTEFVCHSTRGFRELANPEA